MVIELQEYSRGAHRFPVSPAPMSPVRSSSATTDDQSVSGSGQRDRSATIALFTLPMLDWPANLFA
jgi:hypothetical protein